MQRRLDLSPWFSLCFVTHTNGRSSASSQPRAPRRQGAKARGPKLGGRGSLLFSGGMPVVPLFGAARGLPSGALGPGTPIFRGPVRLHVSHPVNIETQCRRQRGSRPSIARQGIWGISHFPVPIGVSVTDGAPSMGPRDKRPTQELGKLRFPQAARARGPY